MSEDDIIRMAREAGLSNDFGHLGYPYLPELERFAALVIAAEREACAQMCEQAGIEGYGTLAAAAMVRARGEK